MKPVRIGMIVLLAAYVALGIHSQVVHLAGKPLPQFLMEDYGYYVQAYARWRAGQSPYADQTIGTAFLYPPPALLLVAGIEALGALATKFSVYASVSLLALVGALSLVVRGCRKAPVALGAPTPRDERVIVAIALALGFGPVAWCLYLGQVNLLVMFCVTAGFYLADRYPYAAGAAIALGAGIKLTPVALLVLMLHRRYLGVFVGFAVTLLALALASAAAFGPNLFVEYLGTVRALKDSFPLGSNGSLSMINTLYLISGAVGLPNQGWHASVQTLWTGLIGASLLAGAYLTRRGDNRQLFFALVAIGMTVVPNVLWYHHLVFLIPPLVTLFLSEQSSALLRAGAVTAFAVMQLDTVLSPQIDKLTTTPICVLLFALTFATLLARSPLLSRREPAQVVGYGREVRPRG